MKFCLIDFASVDWFLISCSNFEGSGNRTDKKRAKEKKKELHSTQVIKPLGLINFFFLTFYFLFYFLFFLTFLFALYY